MYIKDLFIKVVSDPYAYAEELTAVVSTGVIVASINWQLELLKWGLGLAASIFNAFVVNRLKKNLWDKPKKPKKGK